MKLGDFTGENFVFISLKAPEQDARATSVDILAKYGKSNAINLLNAAFNEEQSETAKIAIAGAIVKIMDREKKKK